MFNSPFFRTLYAAIVNETAIRTLVGIIVAAVVAQWNVVGPYSDGVALILVAVISAVAGLLEWRSVAVVVAQNRRPVIVGLEAIMNAFEAKSGYDIPDFVEQAILAQAEEELAKLANKNAGGGGVGSTIAPRR